MAVLLLPGGFTTAAARPVAQVDENVVVQITSPQPGQLLQGSVDITGFAADRRSSAGPGLNERDVALYLNDSADQRNLFDYADTGEDSPEAAAALGPQFAQAGFADSWETCSFPPGHYQLIVWVSSLVVPGARNFASVDVEIAPCPAATVIPNDAFEAHPDEASVRLAGPEGSGYMYGPIFADVAIGLDARCTQTGVDCRYGLEFRRLPGPANSPTDSAYAFWVNPADGIFSLEYYPPGSDPDRGTFLIDDTPAPAIRSGTATNRLGVIAEGDWLRVFVNGQQVGEAHDSSRPWGMISWLGATDDSGRAVEIQFGNLVIATPGPLDSLAPVLRGSS
ncbi:MAG TPA: hypothetical protein VK066_27600 [Chloroflexota bacterium]|nr:hypothetical protein [Chloroflexota bacterium]